MVSPGCGMPCVKAWVIVAVRLAADWQAISLKDKAGIMSHVPCNSQPSVLPILSARAMSTKNVQKHTAHRYQWYAICPACCVCNMQAST